MTKKDYELIAHAIYYAPVQRGDLNGRDVVVAAVAGALAADNPRFDRARFLAACGVEG